ncbi:MAG: Crp/Fnr family transcriptional regulator [Bauldia sp.]|nr:Crp/Fnr family transcriptional regulator [Bauldia sp.]MCW5718123.1 Crp/Fnr family transcriptional regulator [Bauldia sp.]
MTSAEEGRANNAPPAAGGASGAPARLERVTPTPIATPTALDGGLLFRALDQAGRDELLTRARRCRYAAGDTVFHLGDPGQSMMAVVSGAVRISLVTSKGRDVVLADIGPGEVFGEVALLDGRERSAGARALTDCELMVLDRRDVIPLLERRPDLSLRLLSLLCGRLRRSDERMADIAFSELPTRLAKTLLAQPGVLGGERLSLSQSELAGMVGSARENVNRHLRDWRRRGIVELGKGWVAVARPAELAMIAELT